MKPPHGPCVAARTRAARVLHAVRATMLNVCAQGAATCATSSCRWGGGCAHAARTRAAAVRAPVRNVCAQGDVHLRDQFVQAREGNGAVLVNACWRDLLPAINVQAFSVLSSDLLACAKLSRIWSSAMSRRFLFWLDVVELYFRIAVRFRLRVGVAVADREGNGAVLVNACVRDLLPAINVQAFSVLSLDLLACAKLRRIWSSAMERSARVRRNLLCVARVLGTDVNAGQLSCSDRCCVRSVFPAFSGRPDLLTWHGICCSVVLQPDLMTCLSDAVLLAHALSYPILSKILSIVDLCSSNPSTVHREFLRRFPVVFGHSFSRLRLESDFTDLVVEPGSDYFSNGNSTSLVAPNQVHDRFPIPSLECTRIPRIFREQNLLARTIAVKYDGDGDGGGRRERRRGGEFAE
ncbi:putative methionine--tRNA ligase [Dorcoceras hygrometricum]|uniref:Putative methionine--tRNA ligase n=1 Tax=Dorcoceras hygrometricum TaxID=472368 RepID=A0A2Z7ACV3_9LAMI|nr:putative methionine--tRNA ligase [Dorcoceras hygrometricum]